MRVIFLAVLVILTGCAEKAAEKAKAVGAPRLPTITHFYGNEAIVPKGGSLTLCYGTENVETVTMEPYEETGLGPSLNRCVAHEPKKDTTYTLTARGPGGETKATFSVRVGGAASAPAKERVLIQNFQVLGNTPIPQGGRVQLCYSVENATGVEVRPRVDAALTVGRNQCFVVSPGKTTNYILTAKAADGAVDRMQVTVPVQ